MRRFWPCLVLVSVPCSLMAVADEADLRSALAKIEAQCPPTYPDALRAVPEADALAADREADLLAMLSHWNPAVRNAAARELSTRGDAARPGLRAALRSPEWTARAAAVKALSGLLNDQLKNWRDHLPEAEDRTSAAATIRARHSPLADEIVPLLKDPRAEVRNAALGFFSLLKSTRDDVLMGVLALCADEDDFTAQAAMIILEKAFDISDLDAKHFVPALKKALGSPLPRGRGHVVRIISKLDAAQQQAFVPELLAHLDWQPDRDPMFGAGGQEDAMRILTRLQVVELVPRIPALMKKTMRGPGLFKPGVESAIAFGAASKPILPALREELARLEAALAAGVRERHRAGIQERVDVLRKAVDHVERL